MNAINNNMDELIFKELNEANKKFPLFASPHEGYAVVKEEIEEVMDAMNILLEIFSNAWSGIKKNQLVFEQMQAVRKLAKHIATESIQVAAMCDKYNMSLTGRENVDRCVCCGEIIPEGSHTCLNCRGDKNARE